jgi:predicted methyltransferase
MQPLIAARGAARSHAHTSPDLNLTTVEVALDADGVCFPSGECLTWEIVDEIAQAENKCFRLDGGVLREVRVFSEVTNWVRSLYPTTGAPSMLVSGMVMHRVSGIDPHQDTLNKIRAAGPLTGEVLDTATGLGYTAIEAARTASHVLTIELDPASIEIARCNPWSQALFDNSAIEQVIGDAWEVVETLEDGRFSRIIHDPPTFALAGDLYSGEFYAELRRVLKPRGRLFHYIGDPDSPSVKRVQRGVIRRLQEAGFDRVVEARAAFGVVATR